MEERIRKALVNGVMEAGSFLGRARNGKKRHDEIEKRAKAIMLRRMHSEAPELSPYGEKGSGMSVAITPLDSHLNFTRGIGPFGIMAACIEGDFPMAGAVFLPESDELFFAQRGMGASINGRKLQVSARSDLFRCVIGCECATFDQDLMPLSIGAIEILARNAIAWRNSGSPASDYALMARGDVDAVVIAMSESAHAAGILLMQEAGALITDTGGKPFSMLSGPVIAANPLIHEELLMLIRNAL